MLRRPIIALLALTVILSGCLSIPEDPALQDPVDPDDKDAEAGQDPHMDDEKSPDPAPKDGKEETNKDGETEDDAGDDEPGEPVRVPDPEPWYLQWAGERGGCDRGRLVREPTENESFCRAAFAPLSPAMQLANDTLWFTFDASDPTQGHENGTHVEGKLRMFIVGARTGNISFELLADGEVVANTTNEYLIPVDEPSDDPTDQLYRNVTFTMKTHAPVPKGSMLSLRFATTTVSYFEIMSSKEAPSGITIDPSLAGE